MMDEAPALGPSVKASILLDKGDSISVTVSGNRGTLSSALVELKGQCMKHFGEYLLRQNTPLQEPDEVLGVEAASDDDDEEKKEARSAPTKKRK